MPRVDNRPLTQDPTLMANIQSEVSAESRPLLAFITKYARFLVGGIALLIVVLLGTAAYQYIQNSRQAETLDAMARIMARPADAKQIADLEALAAGGPESMRGAVAVALVESAVKQNNTDKAAQAYEIMAKARYDTPLGLTSAVAQAGELLKGGRYAEGLAVLRAIEPRLTQESGQQVRMMMAEAAARAGEYELAAATFDKLAATALDDLDKQYGAARARELRAMAAAGKAGAAEAGAAQADR